MNILGAILLLGITVFVHELGHFLVAVKQGVMVETFSIGLGPKILRLFRWKGTDFILSLIPFGGYVSLGDGDEGLNLLPVSKRWKILVAGPLANALFAGFCLGTYFLVNGEFSITVINVLKLFAITEVAAIVGMFIYMPVLFLLMLDIFNLETFGGPVSIALELGEERNDLLLYLAFINISIGSLNLLPISIVDGGRLADIFYARVRSRRGQKIIRGFKFFGGALLFITVVRACAGDIIRLLS